MLDFVLSVALGVWLGLLYVGGFWLTLRHCRQMVRPAVVYLASLLGRVGGVIFCLYLMGQDGRADRLIACAGGFFLMRGVLLRLLAAKQGKEERIWQR